MDKNKGLNESERLQKAKFEREVAERRDRFEKALSKFKDEYNQLVKEYGIVHAPVMEFDPFKGLRARVVEVDCWKAVKEQELKDSVVVKN